MAKDDSMKLRILWHGGFWLDNVQGEEGIS